MKVIKYKYLSAEIKRGTEEEPIIEQIILDKSMECPTQAVYDANLPIAEKEAIPGTLDRDPLGEFDHPSAPHNITAGEYVTINGVMYKAIENIPNGEHIIVGQNAVITSVEKQLYELTKED